MEGMDDPKVVGSLSEEAVKEAQARLKRQQEEEQRKRQEEEEQNRRREEGLSRVESPEESQLPPSALPKPLTSDKPVELPKKEVKIRTGLAGEELNGTLSNPAEILRRKIIISGAGTEREEREILNQDYLAWKTVQELDGKIMASERKVGEKKSIKQNYTLRELYDLTKEDQGNKSAEYERVCVHLDLLMQAAEKFGTVQIKGKIGTVGYWDALYGAKKAAQKYAWSHNRWHFTKQGDQRYEVCVRLIDLIYRLERQINIVQDQAVSEEKERIERQKETGAESAAREAQQRQEAQKDFDLLLTTGYFTEQERQAAEDVSRGNTQKTGESERLQAAREWVAGSAQYRESLKALIEGREDLTGNREKLLRFLEDRNQRLIVNQAAVRIICEKKKDLTGGLPLLQKELALYLEQKMQQGGGLAFEELTDFRTFLENGVEQFRKENEQHLKTVLERRDILLSQVGIESDEKLWRRKDIEAILTEPDEAFLVHIKEMKEQKERNEEVLRAVLEESGISLYSRERLFTMLCGRLGSSRVFLGEKDLAALSKEYIGMLNVISSEDAHAEERLNILLDSERAPRRYKDGLAAFLAGDQGFQALLRQNFSEQADRAEVYIRKRRTNERALWETNKSKHLTKEQWAELESFTAERGGILVPEEFQIELRTKLDAFESANQAAEGQALITANDYLTGQEEIKSKKYSFGLMSALCGEMFLKSEALKDKLTENERKFLIRNIRALVLPITGAEDMSVLDQGRLREFRLIANFMKEGILQNFSKYQQLGDEFKGDLKRNMLIRMARGLEEKDFDTAVEEERQLLANREELLAKKFSICIGRDPENEGLAKIGEVKEELLHQDDELYKSRMKKIREICAALQDDTLKKNLIRRAERIAARMKDVPNGAEEEEKKSLEKHNLEAFGKRSFDEAMAALQQLVSDRQAGNQESAQKTDREVEQFKRQKQALASYGDGRYALFAEELASIPEVFMAMMNTQEGILNSFCRDVLDQKLSGFAEAMKEESVGKAVRLLYVRKHLKDVFEGKIPMDAEAFRQDLISFDLGLHAGQYAEGKDLHEIRRLAIEDAKSYIRVDHQEGEFNVEMAVESAAGLLMNSLYNDPEQLRSVMNRESFTTRLVAATENYISNLRSLNRKLEEYLSSGVSFTHIEKLRITADFKTFFESKLLQKPAEFEAQLQDLSNFEEFLREREEKNRPLSEDDKRVQTDREGREKVREEKEAGKNRRQDYLKIDLKKINAIRTRNSLVNEGNGEKTRRIVRIYGISQVQSLIDSKLGYLELPQIVRDILTEKAGAFQGDSRNYTVEDYVKSMGEWLYRVYEVFSHEDRGSEEKLSEDELSLLMVHIANAETAGEFRIPRGKRQWEESTEKLKGTRYRNFRKHYKKLQELEEMKLCHPMLEQDRLEMSRELRTMLATGALYSDTPGKGESFEAIVERHVKYLKHLDGIFALATAEMEENPLFAEETAEYKEDRLHGCRDYFQRQIFDELEAGTEFEEKAWTDRIREVFRNPVLVKYLYTDAMSISNTTVRRKKYDSDLTMDDLADHLKKNAGWWKFRKFRKLNGLEQEMFALGLMLMDKGAVSVGSGTGTVLTKLSESGKLSEELTGQIARFVQGEQYHFEINYSDVIRKLTTYGSEFQGLERDRVRSQTVEAFSEEAFDKAMEFAKAMCYQRANAAHKDYDRMADGISSIEGARVLGKKEQLNEAEKLRSVTDQLSVMDVKQRLVMYGKKDREKLGTFDLREDHHLTRVLNRLSKIDENGMMKLIGVLQNRMLLDYSTERKGEYADQEKRDLLKQHLLMQDDTMEFFHESSTAAACYQALISALSFQMKDDRKFKGKRLVRDDYENQSYDRKCLIDWRLLDHALTLIDETEHDSLAAYAQSHAPEYIERSGNVKAIEEYREHKDEKSMQQDAFEEFFRKQALADAKEGAKELPVLLAGYARLDERQKRLFCKVLGRRDLLDISKKNLYRNIVSSARKRGYANESGRNELMDEYILKALGGNEGVVLSDTSYYDAMRGLLSTQIDDTADFKNETDVRQLLAGESFYVFQRNTAVDWKLFRRALQFVNRVSRELQMREGDAELYRSAGDIVQYGHMKMDYSLLRTNIHSTGSNYLRFGAKRGYHMAMEMLSGKYGNVVKGINSALSLVGKYAPMQVASFAEEVLRFENEIDDNSMVGKRTVKWEPYQKTELKAEEGKQVYYYDQMKAEVRKVLEDEKDIRSSIGKLQGIVEKYTPKHKLPKTYRIESTRPDLIAVGIGTTQVPGKTAELQKQLRSLQETRSLAEDVRKAVAPKQASPEESMGKIIMDCLKDKIIEGFVTSYNTGEDRTLNVYAGMLDDGMKAAVASKLKKLKDAAEEDPSKPYKPGDEALTADEKMAVVEEQAKQYLEGTLEGIFGREKMNTILGGVDAVRQVAEELRSGLSVALNAVSIASVCGEAVIDIYRSAKKKQELSDARKRASGQDVADADQETLRKATDVQSGEQKQMNAQTALRHADVTELASQTADTIQDLNISKASLDLALQAASVITKACGVDAGLAITAVKAGLDFALYLARCLKDQKMLSDFFTNTETGKKYSASLQQGLFDMCSLEEKEQYQAADGIRERSMAEFVRTGLGYENMEELRLDMGLEMAHTVVFCASKYNPLVQSRIMAVTVMTVMGLHDSIGKTDSVTCSALYHSLVTAA